MREEKESGERGYWALSWSLKLKPHPQILKYVSAFSYLMNNKYFGFRTSIDVVAGVWRGAAKRWNQMF